MFVGKSCIVLLTTVPPYLSINMISLPSVYYGIPFISFRVISDGCDQDTYNDFWTKAPENSFKVLKSYLDILL